jgi:hypothetical protein
MREGRPSRRTTYPIRDQPVIGLIDTHHTVIEVKARDDSLKAYKGHRNRREDINGSGLTMGGGWINGLGMTSEGKVIDSSSAKEGHLRSKSGLTNGRSDSDVSGFEVRRDLINGLSMHMKPQKESRPPSILRRSARKRWKSRNALKAKSEQPIPRQEAHSCETIDLLR